MIKINLLAEGKRPAVARKGKPQLGGGAAADIGNLLLVAGLVIGLLTAGGWYFLKSSKLKKTVQEVSAAQREVEELEQVIKEVEEYKRKKEDLERKIEVINGLKANQRGPVQIMDQVSRSLPELLWLSYMEVAPATISLRGTALNMSAVANFIDNLDKVEEFAEPILNDATQAAMRGARTETYDYKINLGYSFLKAKTPTLTTTSAGTAPGAQPAAQQGKPE